MSCGPGPTARRGRARGCSNGGNAALPSGEAHQFGSRLVGLVERGDEAAESGLVRQSRISRWWRWLAREHSKRYCRACEADTLCRGSRALLRDSVLDAMRDLLLTRDWSAITLSTWPARRASAGRPSTTNSVPGKAWRRDTRCAWRPISGQRPCIVGRHVGNFYEAFLQGFRSFFAESAADPLVISLLTGVGAAKSDFEMVEVARS